MLALTIHACGLKNASETSDEIVEGVKIDTSLTLENLELIDSVNQLVSVTSEPLITYSRSYCFGMCPVFNSSISQDGKVSYEGINFVDKMGKHEALISASQKDSIIQKVLDINYFELDSAYDNEFIMDIPSVKTSVNMEGNSHNVLDRYQSPKELKKLYKVLDDIFATLEWEPAINME